MGTEFRTSVSGSYINFQSLQKIDTYRRYIPSDSSNEDNELQEDRLINIHLNDNVV